MVIKVYDVGDEVKLDAIYRDSPDGTVQDPDDVTYSVEAPDGTVTHYVYETDDEVEKTSTGVYVCTIFPDASGTWYWRGFSTGTGQTAGEDRFEVRVQRVPSPTPTP